MYTLVRLSKQVMPSAIRMLVSNLLAGEKDISSCEWFPLFLENQTNTAGDNVLKAFIACYVRNPGSKKLNSNGEAGFKYSSPFYQRLKFDNVQGLENDCINTKNKLKDVSASGGVEVIYYSIDLESCSNLLQLVFLRRHRPSSLIPQGSTKPWVVAGTMPGSRLLR